MTEEVHLISKYADEHGNTRHGYIVLRGIHNEKDKDTWIILGPAEFVKKWSLVDKDQFFVIAKNVAKVGYYTEFSYFNLMKSIGKDKILCASTWKCLEGSSRNDDRNARTMHSDGLKLNKGMNPGQDFLF